MSNKQLTTTNEDDTDTVLMAKISDALGLKRLQVHIPDLVSTPVDDDPMLVPDNVVLTEAERLAHEDFNASRRVLLDTLFKGQIALQENLKVACASQTGAAFEAVAKLIKNIAEANQGLLALHEAHRSLMPVDASANPSQNANTINNNIVVSSPAQLLELVREARSERNRIDE